MHRVTYCLESELLSIGRHVRQNPFCATSDLANGDNLFLECKSRKPTHSLLRLRLPLTWPERWRRNAATQVQTSLLDQRASNEWLRAMALECDRRSE